MEVPQQTQQDVEASLRRVAARWAELSDELEHVTELPLEPGSQLELDQQRFNAAGLRGAGVARYARERLWNAESIVGHLEHLVLDKRPGVLNVETVVIFPLLRALIEDAVAVLWLVEPADQNLRLMRGLQLLWDDGRYMTQNHLLLARAARQLPMSSQNSDQLEAHMLEEREELDRLFSSAAAKLDIDLKAISRGPQRAVMLTDAFGTNSVPLATWKLLSDLSHFSITMRNHFESRVDGEDSPEVGHVALVVMAMDVNRCLGLAVEAYERAVR